RRSSYGRGRRLTPPRLPPGAGRCKTVRDPARSGGGPAAMLTLGKFSIGVGDRFARQAKAQLRACQLAAEKGVDVTPVWNKSHREHTIIGSKPEAVRAAADAAVNALGWAKPYHVDADHIRLDTVDD